ncbi:MAG: hypothetical protein OEY87_05410 [Gammaproteobacteria bacterium]|nr:hypothetical protein [Gammaproteobacteria bacterium]MDH5735544.1 hypothetical protein [Gammaproteobacteria bacterium]
MDWVKIGSALFLLAMLVFIFPRMKQALENAPKGNMQDWMSFIVPLAAVIGFVILLLMMV